MTLKICLLMVALSLAQPFLFSQGVDTINEKDISRTMRFLASDSLMGRGNGRPELLKAASFIGKEFSKDGLVPLPGFPGYFIPFRPFGGRKNMITDSLVVNGEPVSPSSFLFIHAEPGLYTVKKLRDFKVVKLDASFTEDVLQMAAADSVSLLLWTDKKQPNGKDIFPESVRMPKGYLKQDVLLLYAEVPPYFVVLKGNREWYGSLEYNVVGLLPGKANADEVVLFSAHYDHEGVYGSKGDSILNGANDNASGTAALIALANYYSKRNDNERTLLFCAFAGEELGLLGSYDLAEKINPDAIVAGINLEMLGVPGVGKNTVFITGEKYSDLPAMLGSGLKRKNIRVINEPDETKQLFKRSDNYPFVMKGIPAHTVMASTDDDACYHQPCDEIKRIDMVNLTHIIKAVAAGATPLVNGTQKPSRINSSQLQ